MKKNNYQMPWEVGLIVIVLLFTAGIHYIDKVVLLEEPHFKIYDKNGNEVDIVYPNDEYNRKINGILKEHLTIDWLDNNCECLEINCSYIFKSSETFESPDKIIGATYEGMIWYIKDKKGNEIASLYCPLGENCFEEECTPCLKYKCGDYTVETWNQIK